MEQQRCQHFQGNTLQALFAFIIGPDHCIYQRSLQYSSYYEKKCKQAIV